MHVHALSAGTSGKQAGFRVCERHSDKLAATKGEAIGQMTRRLAWLAQTSCIVKMVSFLFFLPPPSTQIASHIAIELLECDPRADILLHLALRETLTL